MNISWVEPAYEPLRAWALHPCPLRPPGVAQLLCGGMITWVQQMQRLSDEPSGRVSPAAPTRCCSTPLSTIVATMIAEVCP